MSEVDQIIANAKSAIERSQGAGRAATGRSRASRGKHFAALRAHVWGKVGRIFVASGVILVGATLFGAFVSPLGFIGSLATLMLVAGAAVALGIFPRFKAPAPEDLTSTDIKTIAGKTEIWLESQRRALPAPAQTMVDAIGVQLDLLAPQLQSLDPGAPAAYDIRRLLADDLTGLVAGYRAVPEPLRREARNGGATPDAQLVDGLKLIEREVGDMARGLAAGQLDQLATRQRYLEIKYQGDGSGS
jgi:hypothetical protein